MNKILMTGNPNENIAAGMKSLFQDDINFVSRANGYNLINDTDIQKLVDLSKNYEIFINSSLLKNFAQTTILQRVWTEWKASNKSGTIINFGSSADYFHRADNKLYAVEKRALRDLCKNLSLHCTWHDSKIKVVYFAFGGVDTPKTKEQWPHFTVHSVQEICETVKWILDAPETMNIDELHITPIQPLPKQELKKLNTNIKQPNFDSGDNRTFLIDD